MEAKKDEKWISVRVPVDLERRFSQLARHLERNRSEQIRVLMRGAVDAYGPPVLNKHDAHGEVTP